MASIKNLKKNVKLYSDYLASDVFFISMINKDLSEETKEELFTEIMDLEDEIKGKIKSCPKEKGKTKKYYSEIIEEYNTKIAQLEEKIFSLLPKEEVKEKKADI